MSLRHSESPPAGSVVSVSAGFGHCPPDLGFQFAWFGHCPPGGSVVLLGFDIVPLPVLWFQYLLGFDIVPPDLGFQFAWFCGSE